MLLIIRKYWITYADSAEMRRTAFFVQKNGQDQRELRRIDQAMLVKVSRTGSALETSQIQCITKIHAFQPCASEAPMALV